MAGAADQAGFANAIAVGRQYDLDLQTYHQLMIGALRMLQPPPNKADDLAAPHFDLATITRAGHSAKLINDFFQAQKGLVSDTVVNDTSAHLGDID